MSSPDACHDSCWTRVMREQLCNHVGFTGNTREPLSVPRVLKAPSPAQDVNELEQAVYLISRVQEAGVSSPPVLLSTYADWSPCGCGEAYRLLVSERGKVCQASSRRSAVLCRKGACSSDWTVKSLGCHVVRALAYPRASEVFEESNM